VSDERNIRVVLADDQELVRHGFGALIAAEPGIEVVGQAANGSEAVDAAFACRPDVILMDIRMPVLDGIEATRRISADDRLAGTRVLMLTTFDLDQYVYDALRAGASGFLLKDTPPQQLVDAIRVVAAGDALIAPSITRRLIEEFAARPDPDGDNDALAQLTERERDVLVEVGGGYTNAEIAERLYISPLTVKTHVSRVLAKLDARDRAQLVVVAYETGLVTPGR
jgi:DNA-binding NarL/FixJ family response regulator